MKVRINTVLSHPENPHWKLCKDSISGKEELLQDLGQENYDFALKEGWITELDEPEKDENHDERHAKEKS